MRGAGGSIKCLLTEEFVQTLRARLASVWCMIDKKVQFFFFKYFGRIMDRLDPGLLHDSGVCS